MNAETPEATAEVKCQACGQYVAAPCAVPSMCERNRAARLERADEAKADPPGSTTRHTLLIEFPGGGKLKLERKRKQKRAKRER